MTSLRHSGTTRLFCRRACCPSVPERVCACALSNACCSSYDDACISYYLFISQIYKFVSKHIKYSFWNILFNLSMFIIHPFTDGNGRMARFVMNAMLTTGGYSWTVVPVTVRNQYMAALEKASIHSDITEFTKLISNI